MLVLTELDFEAVVEEDGFVALTEATGPGAELGVLKVVVVVTLIDGPVSELGILEVVVVVALIDGPVSEQRIISRCPANCK